MKLYYKQGACSLASHIILNEIGANFELDEVDTAKGETKSGRDYKTINPNGYVPALELDSGEILTEGPAILQYIAALNGETNLIAKQGTIEQTRIQQHLNYAGTELHHAFGPLFSSSITETEKQQAKANVARKFDYLNKLFSDGRTYVMGDNFTVADAYLFVVSNWSNFVGIDLTQWPHISTYAERVSKRPATQTALKTEGLI